jgi:hypothetical protein
MYSGGKMSNGDFPFNITSNLKKNFRYVFLDIAPACQLSRSLSHKKMHIRFKSNARCHEKWNDELSVATGDATNIKGRLPKKVFLKI